MLQYKQMFKIVLVILSTIIIFYYTNLARPLYSKINDGYFFDDNSCLGYLINHRNGYVCPLLLGNYNAFNCIYSDHLYLFQ